MEDHMVGFEFRPNDDEIVGCYLRNQILGNTALVARIINEVNVCNFDPRDLRLQSKIKSGDLAWYFVSRRENKYASGNQQSRKTPSGFWKLTGKPVDVKDHRGIWCGEVRGKIGEKRVLVFQTAKSSNTTKSDWVMHEYHYTLLPEHQRTYVIYRLEYKGDDINILLSGNVIKPIPNHVANTTYSRDSKANQPFHENVCGHDSENQDQWFNENSTMSQSIQGNSGSYNTSTQYDSVSQQFNMHQFVQRNSRLFNNFSEYDSINQGQCFSGNFNLLQSIERKLGLFNNLSEYDSTNQGQWFSGNFNMPQSIQGNLGSFNSYPAYDLSNQDEWVSFNSYLPQSGHENSKSFNNPSKYDSTNQDQWFSDDFDMTQSVHENSGSFNDFSEYDSANQEQQFSGNFTMS